jgi:hypothetical protein
MIRLKTQPSDSLKTYLDGWLATHSAWSEASNEPPVEGAAERIGGTAFMAADWRFDWDDNSKEGLLADLVANSRSDADWGTIGYHVCEHDGPENQPCPDFDYGFNGGFSQLIRSGVWGSPPESIDPR